MPNLVQRPGWTCEIKVGTVGKLRAEGYQLVTSVLSRFEVIQKLHREKQVPLHHARAAYKSVINDHQIVELGVEEYVSLTHAFLDELASTTLSLPDGIHLAFAKETKMRMCTHDKKAKDARHSDKRRYYDNVFKPEELIGPKTSSTPSRVT